MREIPYNLYTNFNKLDALLKESTSREDCFLRCGLASIELSTFLLEDFLKNGEINKADKVSHILLGIEKQIRLVGLCPPVSQDLFLKDKFSESLGCLKLLDQEYAGVVDRITVLYHSVFKKVETGLDRQINDIRTHFGLSELPIKVFEGGGEKELPDTVEVLELDELEYFNSEDKLFMVTHQISECWFNVGINELESIFKLLHSSDIYDDRIECHFKSIFEVLLYLADHILILEHMVLSDYHPLRVALRGASGGQSQQAHKLFAVSRKAFNQFLLLLEKESRSVIQVLENPRDNIVLLSITNHFAKLERALKNFFFQHYVLSSSIIGSQSFGSIGYDLVSLVDKFVEPVFKEIDQAKYDLTLKTNFKYGSSSGILILEKEKKNTKAKQCNTGDSKIINKVVGSYFEMISQFNGNGWVDLFDKDGYIEDPIGSRPYIGHEQLSIFFKGVLRFFSQLDMAIESMQIEKACTTVAWKARATTYNGKKITFSGKEVFQISKQGKIVSAQVHWNPSVIADQI